MTSDNEEQKNPLDATYTSPKLKPIHYGMEQTPSANPQSTSPYSVIKRHTDRIQSTHHHSLWKLTSRHVFERTRGTISLVIVGEINYTQCATHWRNELYVVTSIEMD